MGLTGGEEHHCEGVTGLIQDWATRLTVLFQISILEEVVTSNTEGVFTGDVE